MNNNKRLQEQIAKAQTMTQFKMQEQITVPTFGTWLNKTAQKDFNKIILDLNETLIEKLQYLLHGKPYIIEHEDKPKELSKFIDSMMLQETMFATERELYENFSAFVIIDKIGSKKKPRIQLRIAESRFPNFIKRLGSIKISAEIWSTYFTNKVKYYIRTITTYDTIQTDVFTYEGDNLSNIARDGQKQDLKNFNKLLPKTLQVKAKIKNPHGFINVEEVQYKPTLDYSWANREKLKPIKRITDKQHILNETVKIMLTEMYTNRTKLLVDKDYIASADREDLQSIQDENIIGVLQDTGNMDGDNKVVEFIQGDPKLDQYFTTIKNIISLAVADLKLSELSEEQSASTATGEIFNKGNDVETANTLQVFRQKAITKILEKSWLMLNDQTVEEQDIDESKWNVQLIPNVIMNEAKMTEIVVQQLSAGLINMVQAKVKLEGISSEDAETSLLEEDAEGIINPSLMATTSFAEDGEERDDKGKEVVDAK